MDIELRRVDSPAELVECRCMLCEMDFTLGTVAADPSDTYGGLVCEECVGYLHGRNPERFPSVELLHRLIAEYPAPAFPSVEAIIKLENEDLQEADRRLTASVLWERPVERAEQVSA
jgi:hypothetical protein